MIRSDSKFFFLIERLVPNLGRWDGTESRCRGGVRHVDRSAERSTLAQSFKTY